MERTRIKLALYVDLDPVPGAMHTAENAASVIQNMLDTSIGHYNPAVMLVSDNMVKLENK